MLGPFLSGCVERHPNKIGNGCRDHLSQTYHIPSGIKVPETKVMGNPRGLFANHSPVGAPFRDILEKQEMRVHAGVQTLVPRSFSLLSLHSSL